MEAVAFVAGPSLLGRGLKGHWASRLWNEWLLHEGARIATDRSASCRGRRTRRAVMGAWIETRCE